MTTAGHIHIERRNQVAIIFLDRPQRRNAFNETMLKELARVTAILKENPPRAVVITGTGDQAFSAGFDVNPDNPMVTAFIAAAEKHDEGLAGQAIGDLRRIVDEFIALPVPIIAALNGIAYGGGAELCVRCDLRVMDPQAVICFSEVRLGLMPDWGGGATLARLIGPSRAADLILTARKVGATEALALGLTNRISKAGSALEEAVCLAEAITANGPRAVRNALEIIRRSQDLSLTAALELELARATTLIASGECIHGVSAFLMKKPPDFPDVA